MGITVEALDCVINKTACDYSEAKEALLLTDGNVEAAIEIVLEERKKKLDEMEDDAAFEEIDDEDIFIHSDGGKGFAGKKREKMIRDRVKKALKEGNADRIQIRRKGEVLLNIPVNVGVIGGLALAFSFPWALIFSTIAAYGFDCKIAVIRRDGSSEEF